MIGSGWCSDREVVLPPLLAIDFLFAGWGFPAWPLLTAPSVLRGDILVINSSTVASSGFCSKTASFPFSFALYFTGSKKSD